MPTRSSAHTPFSSGDTLASRDGGAVIGHGRSEQDRIAQQRIWNDTDQDRDRPDLISLLLQHAQETPDALAVVDDRHRLTYAQLVAHATAVARNLREHGIDAGQSVGISLPRSAEMVVGIVATLLAGGSFVPLDPSWPQARRESVTHDASLSFVLTPDNCALTEDALFDLDATRELFTPPSTDSVAYVIFTSGSTGRPKGAMIRHGAIVERLLWQRDQILFFGRDDASLFKAPLAFDISINEIFLPLVCGGRVVVAAPGVEQDPQRLARLIHREGVTFAYLVSSVLDVMLKQAEGTNLLDSLRHVWCGGEMLTQALFRRFRQQLAIPLYHGYGPAEATIGVSHVIYRDDEDRLNTSIGVANPNCRLYVLDEHLRVVPDQEIGELYVAGFLLAKGYINAPGLTASRFVADVFASDGTRMYRTGDLVRRHNDGSLEFVGRADNQVKIRGMRLELEDVESALVGHPDVEAASVIAREGRLLGYVTVTAGLVGAAIRSWCAEVLPEYMVPAIITVMDELPRTANGKVDRKALPEPDWSSLTDAPADAERDGETVALLAEAMAEALGVSAVGAETDFFDIGGDSLRAITLVSALGRRGVEVSVGDIFSARTPQQLARCAEERGTFVQDPDDEPTGEVQSLPILRWFDSITDHVDGFIQSVEFSVPEDVDAQLAGRMVADVLQAHPALRARVQRNPLRLELPEESAEEAVAIHPTTDIAALSELLDPAVGVVVAAGLVPGRLRLVVHHLVVDGVSWNIIGEDLAAAYRGEQLAPERTSLRRWTQLLQQAVDTGEFAEDANSSLPPLPSADEPLRDPQVPALADSPEKAPTVREERSVVHEASVQITDELLGAVPHAFRTGANSVLLTALSVALARWRRNKQTWTLVEMEGHGRETRFVPGPQGREADLSRTVGWFTCLYPMLIDPTRAAVQEASTEVEGSIAPLALALNAVKDQLAAIPGNGVPYQAHTWLHQSAKTPPQAQVLFNYLGRVSAGAQDFAPAGSTGQLGEQRDPDQPLVRELEFNAIAEDTGEGYVLRTTISWARGRISPERIDELVAHWDVALREVAALADHGVLSVGDVAPAPVNSADLARITAQSSAELQDVLPLTPLQHGMYFHSLFEESASSYVEQQVLRVECSEPFDRERFARAARNLIRRHPALSTRPWETDGGDVVAVIDPGIAEHLRVDSRDVTVPAELAGPGLDGWLVQRTEEIAADDLSRGISLQPPGDAAPEPLMRWTVVLPTSVDGAVCGQDIAVIQTVHHLIADGWSVPIMLRDLLEIYRDDDARIPRYDPDAGMAGSVRWVARRDAEADMSVWREEMREVRPTVLCPNPSSSLERRELLVDDPRTVGLSERARAAGVGLPDVVHAAWGLVLRTLVGCEPGADVVFATSVSGRDIPVLGVADAVGMQLNTIPVVAPGQSDPTLPVTSMLHAMVHHNNQVRDVQHVSLADIARDLGTNASELLDTLMVVEVPLSPQDVGCPGSPLQVADVRNNGAPHFPLSVVVNPSAEHPLRLIYDPQRITEVRAERIAQMLAVSVDSLLSESGAVATVGEVAEALGAVSGVDTLPSLWRRSFEHSRDRPALTSIGEDGAAEHWTYEELDDAAQRIRAVLDRKVAIHTPRVALLMERDAWQVAAILATTMSAGTYVPVDPLSPQARVELILEDCQPDAVLVSPSAEKMVSELVDCPVLVVSEQTMSGEAKPPAGRSASVARANDIAYVIYTSGSTGRPKGVAVTHANVTAMLGNARSHVEFSQEDVWSISHSFAFDFSVWEMWAALSSGGRAVVMPYALMRSPEDAAEVLRAEAITVLSQTPTAFAALEPHLGQDSAVRTVIFGGEALEARAEAAYCSAHPNVRFINMYGITETTVHVTAHECSENAGEARSPIGRPMDGLRTYVLDAQLQPVQPGETGMMYVAGPQVTAGYWGLASTTASRFVADPFVGGGARMYCSNDMAKVLNNGHLDYVGRADRQVQLRGYRVELGEIESALEKVSGVREATVVVVDLPEGQVPGALLITDSRADAKAITSRAAAAARDALPAYMVPQLFAVSTQVPQTINGKRDERAILDLLGEIPAAQQASGTSDLVEAISQAIADALRLDRAEVEPDSDFFRLGGDSILAIRVTHALARADLNVTPRDFFLGRTPRKIAERVTPQATQQKIQETRQSQEEALPKDGHQEISGAFPIPAMLRRQMERGMSDRFVQARRLDLGPVAVEDLEQALQQVAQAHPMLRTRVDTSSAFAHFVGAEGDGPMVVRALDVDALIDHIDIAAGRSVVLGCVDGYVKAVAHHAVIDSASWMILEDDLRDALAGRRILSGQASYKDLCLQELHDAHTAAAQDALHWSELATLPRPVEDSNQWSTDHVSTLEVNIDGQTAQVLQSVAPDVMGVDVQDLVAGLVTVAVARTMGTDARSWAVDVEGHGRPADHSYGRTLGWFTTIAPVEIPLADPADAARAAAEMRALHEDGTAPDRRTYQALRYTHPQGQRTLAHGAQILVNYLGRGETGAVLHAPGDAACQWTDYLVEADVWSSERAVSMELSVVNAVISAERLRSAIGEVARELQEHVSREQSSGRRAPLSVLQRGIWFQSQVAAPGAYVAQTALTFDRRLDAEAVVEAFRDTVTVHPAMGAEFHTDASGQPVQNLPWSGQGIDLPVETTEGDLEAIMHADRSAGIDLASVPLAKATIVTGRSDGQPGDTLLLTYHLVLVDGWSRAVMLQTFLERLTLRSGQARTQGAGELVPRGCSIADALLESVDTRKEQADSDYWVHRLETLSQPTLVAPQAADISSEHAGSELPRQVFAEVSEQLTGALQEKIRAQAVTLTSVVNAAVAVALGAVTGDSDVVFGQSVSGRDALSDPAMSDVVGVLLNTVPVRVTARPGQSIEELVQDVYRQRIEDMDHDSADLGAIQRQLGVGTLFDSMVVVQNFLDPQAAAELRERHGVVEERAEDSTHFPLTWVFTPGPKLGIKLEFRHDVVDESLAHSVLKAATEVLTAFVDTPEVPLAQLAQLAPARAEDSSPQSTTEQMASWQKAEGIDRTIADELKDTAQRFPDRIALADDAQQWTFGELIARCSDIAEKIKNCGVTSGDTVAIAVERSAHSVVALLGALWAGVRYAPLDLTHPDGRLRVLVEDSQPAAALVDSSSRERMERIGALPCVDVTTADSHATTHTPAAVPGDDAYLMYTSGSTGKPKGVVIKHRGLHNMLDNHRRKIFAPAAADGRTLRIAHAISFAFDMSWEELFWLVEGHEVRIFSEDLRRDAAAMVEAIRAHQVDVINVTPTVAEQLLAEGMLESGAHRPRLVLLGGEAVSHGVWETLRKADDVRGYNLYGPTEYTINALGAGTDESATPVIGMPVDRTAAFVLDPWLRPVPTGAPGELYLAGSGLAQEYHGLAARTASSMVACPWGAPGERMYRTGDIVRVRADGMFEYLGRSDDQVKIRGHRVDPGDVSAAVSRGVDPRILHCVTVPVRISDATLLACHLVAPQLRDADQGERQSFLTGVRNALREELPSYMIPDRWSIVDELPVTSNGKTDLAALGEGERITEKGREPANETEEITAELFAESLDIEPEDVPVDADYFDMGGHSMAVIKLCALLRGELGVEVGVREFYGLRTVERVAEFVEARS